MKKILIFLLLVLTSLKVFALTVTDFLQREVEVVNTSKVATLNSSLAQLWELAGGEVSITVQEAIDRGFVEKGTTIIDGASGHNINLELLVAYQPTLVIASTDNVNHINAMKTLEMAHIPVLYIQQDSFEDYLKALKILTDITERNDLYNKNGISQQEEINLIKEQAKKHTDTPTVLFIRAGSGFSSTKAKRKEDHFGALILDELGSINIADEADSLTEALSLEEILVRNPNYILIVSMGNDEASKAYITDLFSKPGWKSLDAVKNNKVVFLTKELFNFKPNDKWAKTYKVMYSIIYEDK